MTPRLWSLSALAVELGMDRRTVAARLRRARPDGGLNGHPAWHLTTALKAVNGPGPSRAADGPPPDMPPWLAAIVETAPTDVERAYCVGIMGLLYQAPLLVATMAIRSGAGLTMTQAHEVSAAVSAMLLHRLFEDARRAGIMPFASAGDEGPEIIRTDAFLPIDWPRLAEEAGEPGWRPPRYTPIWPEPDAPGQEG